MRSIVVYNPIAGRGRAHTLADRARQVLASRGYAVTVEPTMASEDPDLGPAAAIVRRAAGETDRVVVVGGDGTLREAIEGLGSHAASTPVAFVALGNANVIANEFGLPDPNGPLEWITSETARPLDVGRVNGRLFLAVISVGFDTFVTHCVAVARRGTIGRLLYRLPYGADTMYVLSGIVGLGRVLPTRYQLEVDGQTWPVGYPSIWICNTRTFAKDCAITPDANASDGLLDVQACRHAGPIAPFRVMSAARAKRPAAPRVSAYGRGRDFVVSAPAPFRWQIDGDPQAKAERLEIDVLPSFARIVVPSA